MRLKEKSIPMLVSVSDSYSDNRTNTYFYLSVQYLAHAVSEPFCVYCHIYFLKPTAHLNNRNILKSLLVLTVSAKLVQRPALFVCSRFVQSDNLTWD